MSKTPATPDCEWVNLINQKNFRYGLTPRPKAREKKLEAIQVEGFHAETEDPERDLVRERPMQAVRPARDQVRA
jgi:hypothetical protein